MTDWSLDDEEQFDFMDPNDPTSTPSAAAGVAAEQAATPGGDADEGGLTGAASDPTGAVHIWLDDDRRVTGVRLSNRWRERLKDAALADVVVQLISGQQSHGQAFPDLPGSTEQVEGRAMSEEALDALLERTLELDDKRRKLEALPPEDVVPTRWKGSLSEGASANRMVTVTLGIQGITHRVTFEEDWLADVKTADLGAAILQAHQDAYSRFKPPTLVPGDFAKLAVEGELLHNEAMAMMARGL